jgi:lysophospholipase L1-like esterase
MSRLVLSSMFALVVAASAVPAQDKKNAAAVPAPRGKEGKPDPGWLKRHEGFVEIAKKGGVDVLFLGDSITDAWGGSGRKGGSGAKAFQTHFEPLKAANFGIGGDRTQHVLWRITNGELDGINPKVAMLMIGTNNSNGADHTAAEIAEGVALIVKTLRERKPEMKVLLLAIFPRAEKGAPKEATRIAAADLRRKTEEVNKIIAELDDGKMVKFLNINAKFLDAEGGLSREIMPDLLHLSGKGYDIWAEAVLPVIKAMMN